MIHGCSVRAQTLPLSFFIDSTKCIVQEKLFETKLEAVGTLKRKVLTSFTSSLVIYKKKYIMDEQHSRKLLLIFWFTSGVRYKVNLQQMRLTEFRRHFSIRRRSLPASPSSYTTIDSLSPTNRIVRI